MLLKATDLNVYYGAIHAIKGVSFEVNEGEIVTLIGANGAGKSTTLKTISGMLRSRTGSVEFEGKDISKIPAYKLPAMGIAHVPEGRRIFQELTVTENLEMGAYTRSASEIKPSLENVFNRFPRLRERKNQIAGTLSGGEQQMLAIGRAMMGKPRMLLLDEPSLGLAPLIINEIFAMVDRIREMGTTILLVEQNARIALKHSDRAYVLETGSIVLSDRADQLLESDEVRKAYFGGL